MPRVRLIPLVVSLLCLVACASPGHETASAKDTGFTIGATSDDAHHYEATHPDGPYEPTDPFGPLYNPLERLPPADLSH
jgi:hypothetical protein